MTGEQGADAREGLSPHARRRLAFACFVVPLAGWAIVWTWVAVMLPTWADSAAALSLPVRVAIHGANWSIRMLPFVILAVVATGPLLVAAIAAAAGSLGPRADPGRRRAILRWWSAAVGMVVVPAVLAEIAARLAPAIRPVLQHPGAAAFPALTTLFWASFVCWAISLGDAFALQRARVASGASSIRMLWLTVGSVVLCYGCYALVAPLPLVIWWASRHDPAGSLAGLPRALDSSASTIAFDASGFTVTPEEQAAVAWSDVCRVIAFKRDVYAYDLVCLAIELPGPRTVELDEQMRGWDAFLDALPTFLPGATPWSTWFDSVAQPPFETNPTVVYTRGTP